MSDFTYIGKKIACEPYVFRGEITASNKLTVVSSSNFFGSMTASIISASKFIGYIDSSSYSLYAETASYALNTVSASYAYSSSYALTASYALNGGGLSLVTGSTYPITSSWALNALSSAFAYSSSYALTASYALNAGSGGGNIFVATSSVIDINFSSSVNNFVTDGILNSYTLTYSTYDPTQLLVFLDGLEQEPTTDYTVSGTTLSLTSVPPPLLELEVRRFYSSATISILTSSLNAQYFTGDGVTSQYNLTQSVLHDYDILVTINGLVKKPSSDYTTTGSILNFTSAPTSGSEGQFRYLLTSTTGYLSSLITGSTYPITSSNSISSSYAVTASYALNGGGSSLITGSTYPITSSWALNSDTSSYVNPLNQIVILTKVSSSLEFADDNAAAAGGIPLGGLYRNGNFILIRLN